MNFNKYENFSGITDLKEYREKSASLKNKFKNDLLIDLGINDHKNAERLFYLAWEYGHSGGYSEVYNYAMDMADLLK